MSDQQVTEDEIPCITGAPKSLGQVGYEALLAVMHEREEKAGRTWTDDPELWAFTGDWENQPPILREDWEAVAAAIEREASPLLYHRCLRLKAELAETKHLLSEERALTAATVGKVPT